MFTLSKRRILPASPSASPAATAIRFSVACLAAIALMLGARGQAHAQQTQSQTQTVAPQISCGSHAEISGKLADRFSEAAVAMGLTSTGEVIDIFTSSDGETWTIVMTRPDGTSCLMAAGRTWEAIEPDLSSRGPQA